MSSVRMCDRCGNIFSENEEDWSTFSGTILRRRENGSRYNETVNQDACGRCTAGAQPVAPRLAIPVQPAEAHSTVKPGHPDYARIAELERENGLIPTVPDGGQVVTDTTAPGWTLGGGMLWPR